MQIKAFNYIIYFFSIPALAIILISCSNKQPKIVNYAVSDSISIYETFADSLLIGTKGLNKIELIKYNNNDENIYTRISFYKKEDKEWTLIHQNTYPNSPITYLDVEIKDYNNDGYNDFTYSPNVAARGGNTIHSLFIYKPEENRLQLIQNSEEYPNLNYNEKLDCIDSFALYGGSTTSFLQLQDDSLFCFATVSLYLKEREIITYDKSGKETILLSDTLGNEEHVYMQFSDYTPQNVLKEYQEFITKEE